MKLLENRICPKCGAEYHSVPAVSRTDNSTLICPECGIREALESIGVGSDEQEIILETIKKSKRG